MMKSFLSVGMLFVIVATIPTTCAFSITPAGHFSFRLAAGNRIRQVDHPTIRINTALSMEQVYNVDTSSQPPTSSSTASTSSSQKMEQAMMKNEQKQRLPSWIDLPLASTQSTEAATANSNSQTMRSAELAVGRVAMVGAILLILGEIMTGQTFWQQMLQTGTAQVTN